MGKAKVGATARHAGNKDRRIALRGLGGRRAGGLLLRNALEPYVEILDPRAIVKNGKLVSCIYEKYLAFAELKFETNDKFLFEFL